MTNRHKREDKRFPWWLVAVGLTALYLGIEVARSMSTPVMNTLWRVWGHVFGGRDFFSASVWAWRWPGA